MDSAVAIVGMSFRMPQDTVDEAGFWDVLANRRCLQTEWPADRVSVDGFYDESHKQPNTVRDSSVPFKLNDCIANIFIQLHSRGAHFLKGDPAAFDAPFFAITAKEAAAMDPQQRWALEAAYHAFENGTNGKIIFKY